MGVTLPAVAHVNLHQISKEMKVFMICQMITVLRYAQTKKKIDMWQTHC